MKVLHICTKDSDGAGLCAYRINKSLQNAGIESNMLVLECSHTDDKSVYAPYRFNFLFFRLLHKILRFLHIYHYNTDKLLRLSNMYGKVFTTPEGFVNIVNNKLVKEADIIHLHWVNNFVNLPVFFNSIKKPVVWTLHDENLFLGMAHYSSDVIPNNDIENTFRVIKANMIGPSKKCGIVFLSRFFMRKFGENEVIKNCKKTIINNSVDCSLFHMKDKAKAKEILGLDKSYIYLSFLSSNITDPRKGLDRLMEAAKSIKDKHIRIIAIGNNDGYINNDLVLDVGTIKDPAKLSLYLSASDYFVMASLQEAFSQAPIEAMACGTPAIVTPVSGTEELITEDNGVICEGFTSSNLADGIIKAMSKNYNGENIRKDVEDRFSPSKIAIEYIKFYKELI